MEGFAAPGLIAPATLPAGLVAIQSVQVLRLSDAGYTTAAADDPAHTPYPPRLLSDIEVGQSMADAIGLGGRVALTIGEATLWDGDRQLESLATAGTADGRGITIRVADVTDPQAGNYGTALGSAAIAIRGTVRRIDGTAERHVRLGIADIAERLATPLQATRYLGTGGTEGPAELAGRPKPVALGSVFNAAPIPLGSIDLGDGSLPTYQVHWRAVDDITAVRIRGVEQSPVDPPGVGEFKAWNSLGMFQIGSSPDGLVTCDVDGDATPLHVATTAGIVRRLIQSLGPQFSDAEIQEESFSFADTDLPGPVGWYRGIEEITAEQAVAEILAGCGAGLAGGRAGTVRLFDLLAGDAAQFTLTGGHILALEPLPLPATLRPLPRAVAVEWLRNWAPSDNLAGSVAEADRAKLANRASGPYRATSDDVTFRVLQQRELRLPGLYFDESDAQVRAERWRDFIAASPRMFRITTDRYLHAIEMGDLGWIAYPAFGLQGGAGVVVVGWRNLLAARRLTLDVVTVPWVEPSAAGPIYPTDGVY